MITRRKLLLGAGAAALVPAGLITPAIAGMQGREAELLVAIGPVLRRYRLPAQGARVTGGQDIAFPADIFYACFHPNLPRLYVIGSDADTPGRRSRPMHYLSTLEIDPATGALQPAGAPRTLPAFANHITTDPQGTMLLLACHAPSMLLAYALDAAGMPGRLAAQAAEDAVGAFAHQVAVAPAGDRLVVCARGNDARAGRAEDRGALTVFDLRNGSLQRRGAIGMPPGLGPRNLAFHPSRPWFYVGMERGNKLAMYGWSEAMPQQRFLVDTLPDPASLAPRQRVGAVRMHPSGRTAYVANRADRITGKGEAAVFAGGENSIAVFALDAQSGEPILIQQVDTGGIEPRSFALNPAGNVLAVGNQTAFTGDIDGVRQTLPAGIVLFSVRPDGTLERRGSHAAEGGALRWLAFSG